MNKQWAENDGCYELHFERYYDDDIILKFCQDKEDANCFWYVSDMLKVEQDCVWTDNIDEAKEDFEYKISEYFQDQINYYDDLLKKFEED